METESVLDCINRRRKEENENDIDNDIKKEAYNVFKVLIMLCVFSLVSVFITFLCNVFIVVLAWIFCL